MAIHWCIRKFDPNPSGSGRADHVEERAMIRVHATEQEIIVFDMTWNADTILDKVGDSPYVKSLPASVVIRLGSAIGLVQGMSVSKGSKCEFVQFTAKPWSYSKGYYPSAEGGNDGWYYLNVSGKDVATIWVENDSMMNTIVDALNNRK